MKHLSVLSLAIVLVSAGVLSAGELKSGPQEGDRIGAFNVTKCAGAEEDGVEVGANLCYRCRNGDRPQVIVFTRSTDKNVMKLLRQIDKAVAKNEDAKLRSFVNLLGEDKEELTAQAKKVAAKSKTSNLPIVVPNEFENGPDNSGINTKAAVTVVLASDLGVKASHAVADSKDLDVEAVIKDLSKILN
jgi:hypothetical protein